MSHAQEARDLLEASRGIPRVPDAGASPTVQAELLLKEAHVESMLAVADEVHALSLLLFNRDLAEVVVQERRGGLDADPDGAYHRDRAERFEALRKDVRRDVVRLLGYSDRIEHDQEGPST